MKYAWIALAVLTTPVHAESLCDVSDMAQVLDAVQGGWTLQGGTSVEGTNVSVTENTIGHVAIDDQGRFASVEVLADEDMPQAIIDGASPMIVPTATVYDVDGVDDILDTVEAPWIADALSMTPCGPEGLQQLNVPVETTPEVNAVVTLIPYFTDGLLLISEAEVTGEWGIAFITSAGLLRPIE